MLKIFRFSDISMAIQALAYAFQPTPGLPGDQFDNTGYSKAIRAAQRRHDRFYGCTSKYKPMGCQPGSRQHLRYIKQAKRIEFNRSLRAA